MAAFRTDLDPGRTPENFVRVRGARPGRHRAGASNRLDNLLLYAFWRGLHSDRNESGERRTRFQTRRGYGRATRTHPRHASRFAEGECGAARSMDLLFS